MKLLNLKYLLTVFAALLIASCGGGGGGNSSCRVTGVPVETYSGETLRDTVVHVLQYKLGVANTWSLSIQGVTAGCLTGLKVVPRAPQTAGLPAYLSEDVPPGFKLDTATGAISTGVLTSDVEGVCQTGSGTIVGGSVNRTCPAGQTLSSRRVVLQITSPQYNTGASPTNTVLVFEP